MSILAFNFCNKCHKIVQYLVWCRHFKMSRMYYFILHLSLADLLTALLTLFPEIVWTFFLPCFYAGNVACKVMKFLQMVGPYLSSYVLIMTAIDRYQVRIYYYLIHKAKSSPCFSSVLPSLNQAKSRTMGSMISPIYWPNRPRPNRWSSVSHMVSVRPYVRPYVHSKNK